MLSLFKFLLNCAIQIVIGAIAYFLIVWIAALIAVPFEVVRLIGILIFLWVIYQIYLLFQSNPPRVS